MQGRRQRMTIIGITLVRQRSYEPATPAGCRNADLAAELIPFVRLAFTDTINCRFMNTVHLVFVTSLLADDPCADCKQ